MKMIKEQPEKIYTTLDAYQAGFLTLRGFVPNLVDQKGKIVFVFTQSDDLLKELASYNAGALVEYRIIVTLKIKPKRSVRRKRSFHRRDIRPIITGWSWD